MKIPLRLVTFLGAATIRFVGRTSRIRLHNADFALERARRGESVIWAFWHNRFFMMPFFYRYVRGRKTIAVLASRSRDGAYISGVVERFGFRSVRGSTSRGARAALLSLARLLRDGLDGCVTPDGPRGPRYRVQPGVLALAAVSGAPILPVSYAAKRKKVLRSWDRFLVPFPFNRFEIAIGDPVWVEKGDLEEKASILEERLLSLNERSDALLRGE